MSVCNELRLQESDVLGTWLASQLTLNTRYFSKVLTRSSVTLNKLITVKKHGGLIFVSIPLELKKYIEDDRYIATKLTADDDIEDYEYIFSLTKDTKIGFWK